MGPCDICSYIERWIGALPGRLELGIYLGLPETALKRVSHVQTKSAQPAQKIKRAKVSDPESRRALTNKPD